MARPTDYDPAYCDEILGLGKQGKSIVQMANHFEVVKQTLINWTEEHPEFLAAFTRAKQLSQEWWETVGQMHIVETPGGNKINAGLYSRSMAARFPEDYREKQDVNLGGQQGNPVQSEVLVKFVTPDNNSDT